MNTQEHRIKIDILERTRRMTTLCHKAESSGIETVVALADQGEHLENINLHLSSIDSTLVDTRQNINRMKGLTQRLIDAIRHRLDRFSHVTLLTRRTHSSNKLKEPLVATRCRRSAPDLIDHTIRTTIVLPPIVQHSNDPLDHEIDRSLSEAQTTIQRLKHLALDMNNQLTGQNVMLNQIHESVIQSTTHIHQQDSAIRDLI